MISGFYLINNKNCKDSFLMYCLMWIRQYIFYVESFVWFVCEIRTGYISSLQQKWILGCLVDKISFCLAVDTCV